MDAVCLIFLILFLATSSSLFEITGVLGDFFTILWSFDAEQKGALTHFTFQQTLVDSSLNETTVTTTLNKDVRMYDVNLTGSIPDNFEGTSTFTLIAFPDKNPSQPDLTTRLPLGTTQPAKTNERTVLPVTTVAYTTPGKFEIKSDIRAAT